MGADRWERGRRIKELVQILFQVGCLLINHTLGQVIKIVSFSEFLYLLGEGPV